LELICRSTEDSSNNFGFMIDESQQMALLQ
jgi:hypothetical protein